MGRQWTFGKKVGAGFGFSAAVLLLIAFVGYRSVDGLIENNRLVDHTRQVRKGLSDLLSQVKDAETGQRGFVITGDDSFLDPYRSAVGLIHETLDNLRRLTSDNPAQQRRLDAAGPIIDAKLSELERTIEQRRSASFDVLSQVVAAGEGKNLMEQIRSILSDMDRHEEDLLAARAAEAEASVLISKRVVLGGSLAGTVLIAAIGFWITSSLTRQIGSAVQRVRSSSTELQAAANQQATGAKQQVTAISEMSTTITELLATSRQIAESGQRVARIAGQTQSGARSGEGTVEGAHESISDISRQVEFIVNHMLELGKKSQQIGAVLDIVSELAEQTNILAINATIEAAGAGESGKRFGVVADEIRKLADRVTLSAKEIRTLIEEVRSAVNTTVMTTETGAKAVAAGTRQFGDVTASFKTIAGLVGTTTEAAREIELSTKQQTSAVEQVNLAIGVVAQTTRETEASSGQTLQTASELAALSQELLRLVRPQAAAANGSGRR